MKKYILIILILCSHNLFSQTGADWTERGIAKVELKDYSGAIADFNKAIELNDQYKIFAYFIRGIAKVELKDYRGAILDFNKAMELSPNDASIYSARGYAKSKLKDYSGDRKSVV